MPCFSSCKPFIISPVLFLIPCTFKVPNRIVLLRSLCRRRLHLCRVFPMGVLASYFFRPAGGWPAALTPNLEDQVVFGQGFLPLALDTLVSNCKAAVLVLVRPGYFISPVPAISGAFPYPPPGVVPDGRLATLHGDVRLPSIKSALKQSSGNYLMIHPACTTLAQMQVIQQHLQFYNQSYSRLNVSVFKHPAALCASKSVLFLLGVLQCCDQHSVPVVLQHISYRTGILGKYQKCRTNVKVRYDVRFPSNAKKNSLTTHLKSVKSVIF